MTISAAAVLAQDASWLDGAALAERGARILLIVLLAATLRLLAGRLISRMVRRSIGTVRLGFRDRPDSGAGAERAERIAEQRRRQRAETISSVLTAIVSVTIVVVTGMLVLGELGVDLAPLLASAGIIGLAIGFGAQSLVRDVVSGIFMLIEDQYGVGDWADVGAASGEVERVGLRVTELRDENGVLWFVRNGEIARVGNHAQDWARALLDVPVGYDADIEGAGNLLLDTARELRQDPGWQDAVLEDPELWGVSSLSGAAVVLQLAVVTAPQQQWGVARELRHRIKVAFDRAGVRIPLQQQVVWTPADGATGSRESASGPGRTG